MKSRKISSIEFFLEQREPQYDYDVGFHKINGIWMRDRVKIDGEEPDCRAIDTREFDKMLAAPGDYEPLTCTCGYMEDCNIQYPVRCFHNTTVRSKFYSNNELKSSGCCGAFQSGGFCRVFLSNARISRREKFCIIVSLIRFVASVRLKFSRLMNLIYAISK